MIDDVRTSLTALRARGLPADGELGVIDAGAEEAALLALDHLGRPHLLLPAALGSEPLKSETATLEIDFRSIKIGGVPRNYLDTVCLFESVAEVFEHFVVAVLTRVAEGDDGADALAAVLTKWKQFLTPPKASPGRDQLVALFGELLVLRDLAEVDPGKALAAWVGPRGARHDFRRASVAIEVKTTRSHTARRVTVHGEDQLDTPEGGSLHLHLVRVEEVAGAERSISGLVDDVLSSGVQPDGLFDALASASLPIAELAGTGDLTFEIRERLTIPVDERTPRITPASFVGGARPTGVLDLRYEVDLDHGIDSALDEQGYEALIADLVAA